MVMDTAADSVAMRVMVTVTLVVCVTLAAAAVSLTVCVLSGDGDASKVAIIVGEDAGEALFVAASTVGEPFLELDTDPVIDNWALVEDVDDTEVEKLWATEAEGDDVLLTSNDCETLPLDDAITETVAVIVSVVDSQ